MPPKLDHRTLDLFDALRSPGAALLFELFLHGKATERDLVRNTGATQATANRRLHDLDRLGLVERDSAGRTHAPNRPWSIRHRDAVGKLLLTAIDLADQSATREARRRRRSRAALLRIRQG